MSLPLLLGEAPGSGGGTRDPLGARTARRLADLAGWPPERGESDPYRAALARRFELRNLLARNPGKVGKGAAFPLGDARLAAAALDLDGRTVIALGKRVAAALGIPTDYFEWRSVRGARVVVVPHPSGINRVLNDAATREATGAILREVAA